MIIIIIIPVTIINSLFQLGDFSTGSTTDNPPNSSSLSQIILKVEKGYDQLTSIYPRRPEYRGNDQQGEFEYDELYQEVWQFRFSYYS